MGESSVVFAMVDDMRTKKNVGDKDNHVLQGGDLFPLESGIKFGRSRQRAQT